MFVFFRPFLLSTARSPVNFTVKIAAGAAFRPTDKSMGLSPRFGDFDVLLSRVTVLANCFLEWLYKGTIR
jgi:hypothetical protein